MLAFQDDYIDLAQLAAVCRAWVADKSRSFPQLLVERQWLSESERDELERKVERKLKRFVGDVHATLGVVADGAVRDVLKLVADPDVNASLSDWPDGGHVLMQTLVPDPQSPDKSESRYTLTHVQGEGTFGKVWMAYDKQLDREVALKELQPSKSRNPDLWRRFLREAQVTGKLQHPNIVPVYDLDRRAIDQQPFYTMKLVQGRTLREAIAAYHQQRRVGQADPLALNRLLQSFIQICEALAYAHSRSVIHRDLKPHNIVLGDFGEVIVLDWGEAKLVGTPEPPTDPNTATVQESEAPLDSSSPAVRVTGDAAEAARTVLGQAKGSLGYMSPEQVTGQVDQMEPRTDVYGLGAILFDILTDQPPHATKEKGLTLDDWRSRILANPTPRVRVVDPSIPNELDSICAKAMAKDREGRFHSAKELADSVRLWLSDAPTESFRQKVAIATAQADQAPNDPGYQEATSRCRVTLALVLMGMGRHEEAVTELRQATAIYGRLAKQHPEEFRYLAESATTRQHLEAELLLLKCDDEAKSVGDALAADYREMFRRRWNSNENDVQFGMAMVSVALLPQQIDELKHQQLDLDDSVSLAMEQAKQASKELNDVVTDWVGPSRLLAEGLNGPKELNDVATDSVLETLHEVPAGPSAEGLGAQFEFDGVRIQLLQKIGEGGAAIIYEALELPIGRKVALKVPRSRGRQAASIDDSQLYREAQILAYLDHPHVLPLYGIGKHDGRIILSTKLVTGGTLLGLITHFWESSPTVNSTVQLTLEFLVDILIDVCDALAYAHSRGIVHVDPKPANILLSDDGWPYVCDWGLSVVNEDAVGSIKVLSNDNHQLGSVVGTPAYMPPEIARGESGCFAETADIYVIGVTLFQILTGSLPYRASNLREMLSFAQSLNPSLTARSVNGRAPKELNAICAKAMAKDRTQRYQEMAQFSRDLRNWREGQPVSCLEDTFLRRTARMLRKVRGNPLHPTPDGERSRKAFDRFTQQEQETNFEQGLDATKSV